MDHANLESMSVFVKSFLRSRSHSILNETDLEHLAHCILKVRIYSAMINMYIYVYMYICIIL